MKPHLSRYWLNNERVDAPETFDQEVKTICDAYEEALEWHEKGAHLLSTDEKTGIQVLEHFLKRGMQIRLFNLETEIQTMLDLSGKRNIIKSYNETDTDKAVSLFEKEILKKKDKVSRGITGRRYIRVNASFPKEFKYHTGHNGEIEGKAHVLNLSEGGLLADRIIAFNLETGKVVRELEIAGCEIHDIKFSLNVTSKLIETKGRCIWQKRQGKDLCIGIRFKDMSKVHKDMIRNYVYESIQSKDKP